MYLEAWKEQNEFDTKSKEIYFKKNDNRDYKMRKIIIFYDTILNLPIVETISFCLYLVNAHQEPSQCNWLKKKKED